MVLGETIAAIATAPGRGGVAVIRVSGHEAWAVAKHLTGVQAEAGRVRFVMFRTLSGEVLDQGLLIGFRAPHSYTGEDVVELQCHGGTITPRRILEACFTAGARLARRGEFTERAYLNGKLDYEQSAAVLDLIDAKTTRAANRAIEGLAGRTQRAIHALYDEALGLSAEFEHALDIDEGELPPAFFAEMRTKLATLREHVATEIRRVHEGHILRDGALVVLAGPPNVGKSSLLNALVQENRAIVSDVPGTTRDAIEAWLDLEGWPIRLVDTAGLRTTEDLIEAEGVRRSQDLISRADIVLRLYDQDRPEATNDNELLVRTKADLSNTPLADELAISVRTGFGLDTLKAALLQRLATLEPADGAQGLAELHRAEVSLPRTLDDLVLAANGIRAAACALGEWIGATYSADLLDRLFSRFCVGK